MPQESYLGIYLSSKKATAVCLKSAAVDAVEVCFEISLDPGQLEAGAGLTELVNQIAQNCTQKNLVFSHIGIAIESSQYMQHRVHSSFTDAKQIASTARFDTEEALATDVSDVAIAYRIASTNDNGSKLRVFTAQKEILTGIINTLASNGLDPVTVEPDIICMTRFFTNKGVEENSMVTAISKDNGYIFGPFEKNNDNVSTQRTFLTGGSKDNTALLAQQIKLTFAQVENLMQTKKLLLLDPGNTVSNDNISEQLSLPVETTEINSPSDCDDPVAFTAACGAALSHIEKEHSINFRNDHMPYLGKRRRLEKTIKIVCVSLCIMFIALGANLQFKLIKEYKPFKGLRSKFAEDYTTVMPGKKWEGKPKSALNKLGTELRRIQRVKKGFSGTQGKKSIVGLLTDLISAFNKTTASTNLKVEKISLTSKNIRLEGNTSRRTNSVKFIDEIKKTLSISNPQVIQGTNKEGRDTFIITIDTKDLGS